MTLLQQTSQMVAQTPTAQRRAKIPVHRRRSMVRQTVWAVALWCPLTAFVYVLGVPVVWHLVVFLFCLRIANRDLLVDCLKMAKEVVGLFLGVKHDG